MCNSTKTKHNDGGKSNTIVYQIVQIMGAFHSVFPKLYVFPSLQNLSAPLCVYVYIIDTHTHTHTQKRRAVQG